MRKREPLYLSLKAVGSAHNSKIRKAYAYRVSIHKSLQRITGIFRCLHLMNFLHSQGLNEIANAILLSNKFVNHTNHAAKTHKIIRFRCLELWKSHKLWLFCADFLVLMIVSVENCVFLRLWIQLRSIEGLSTMTGRNWGASGRSRRWKDEIEGRQNDADGGRKRLRGLKSMLTEKGRRWGASKVSWRWKEAVERAQWHSDFNTSTRKARKMEDSKTVNGI